MLEHNFEDGSMKRHHNQEVSYLVVVVSRSNWLSQAKSKITETSTVTKRSYKAKNGAKS